MKPISIKAERYRKKVGGKWYFDIHISGRYLVNIQDIQVDTEEEAIGRALDTLRAIISNTDTEQLD